MTQWRCGMPNKHKERLAQLQIEKKFNKVVPVTTGIPSSVSRLTLNACNRFVKHFLKAVHLKFFDNCPAGYGSSMAPKTLLVWRKYKDELFLYIKDDTENIVIANYVYAFDSLTVNHSPTEEEIEEFISEFNKAENTFVKWEGDSAMVKRFNKITLFKLFDSKAWVLARNDDGHPYLEHNSGQYFATYNGTVVVLKERGLFGNLAKCDDWHINYLDHVLETGYDPEYKIIDTDTMVLFKLIMSGDKA